MITYADASGPVTGEPGDPDFGRARVCMYHDSATGSLMYRVEKEASDVEPEAHQIAVHVSPAYCKRLLAYIQSQGGGELGAKGYMLLIRGATLASDSASHTLVAEVRAGFPDPLRPTRHNPEGSLDWSGQARQGDAITPPEGAITPPEEGLDSIGELPF